MNPTGALTVSSSVLTVTKGTTLTVPIGAAKSEGCGLVQVAWWSCGVKIASDNPYVLLNLPAVTGLTVKLVTHEVIFFASDPVAAAPLYRPTSTQLMVVVSFANKVKKDFSKDKRAVFSVDKATLAEVYDMHFAKQIFLLQYARCVCFHQMHAA